MLLEGVVLTFVFGLMQLKPVGYGGHVSILTHGFFGEYSGVWEVCCVCLEIEKPCRQAVHLGIADYRNLRALGFCFSLGWGWCVRQLVYARWFSGVCAHSIFTVCIWTVCLLDVCI